MFKNLRIAPWVREALPLAGRLIVGGTLIAAGALKLNPIESARAVRAYRILPEAGVQIMGIGLPLLEITLGILLIVGLGTRFVAAVAALLFVVFIAGIISVWIRGISIDCGCFGGGGTVQRNQTQYPLEIARDLGLLLVSFALVWRPRSKISLDGVLGLFTPRSETAQA